MKTSFTDPFEHNGQEINVPTNVFQFKGGLILGSFRLLNLQIEKNAKTYADIDLFLIVNEKYLKDIGAASLRELRS